MTGNKKEEKQGTDPVPQPEFEGSHPSGKTALAEITKDLGDGLDRISVGRCNNGLYVRIDDNIQPKISVYSFADSRKALEEIVAWFGSNGGPGCKNVSNSVLSHLKNIEK